MKEIYLNTLHDVITTLNNIEVHGKTNMDRLLGAIMAVEAIIADVNNPADVNKTAEE